MQLQDQPEGQLPAPLQDGQAPAEAAASQPHHGGRPRQRVEVELYECV